LAAWGNNNYGQCDVPQDKNFTAIAAGGYHSLAIHNDGSLAAWGWDKFQQCEVPAGKFVAIAAGSYHSLAIRSDGSLVAWGDNTHGQCNVPLGKDFIAVEANGYCSRAFKKDGSAIVFGLNESAQYMPPDTDIAETATGGFHTVALKLDGTLAAWGWDAYRQCTVPHGNGFVAVAAGGRHSVALRSDQPAETAGLDVYRQIDNTAAAPNFLALARSIYYRLAVLGEPVILLLLSIIAVLLFVSPKPVLRVSAHRHGHARRHFRFML
jgi:alpha-tubulin suppressor-like RCC1 family protein